MYSRRRFLLGSGSAAASAWLVSCSGSSSSSSGTGSTGSTTPPPQPASLYHYITTGQSLATGTQGQPGLSTAQPFSNVMFTFPNTPAFADTPIDFNAVTNGYTGITFRPLLGGPSISGANGTHETIANGFADSLTAEGAAYKQLLSCSGVQGTAYSGLAGPTDYPPSGSPSFLEMMSQVSTGMALAKAAGLVYSVPAMVLIHGEFDGGNFNYATNLATWQSDMQKGVNATTGGSGVIPMIQAQTQAQTASLGGADTIPFHPNAGGLGTVAAAIANPGLIYVACPEYMMAHHYYEDAAGNPDPLGQPIHMTADGYRHLGLMMAKAAKAICIDKTGWLPVVPKTLSLRGNLIRIEYNVPVEPLVIDTSYVTDPGNYGFVFTDDYYTTTTFTSITGVAVTGPAEITVSLSAAAGAGFLTYALVDPGPVNDGVPVGQGFGPTAGPRGCVRDSDPTVSYYKNSVTGQPYPMQNYSVAWQSVLLQGQTLPYPTFIMPA